jgi:hypothetical protein
LGRDAVAVDEVTRQARPTPVEPAPVDSASLGRGVRRRLLERITPGLLVGLLAALLAFVLVAGVLRDRRATVEAAVPTRVIAAGETVSVDAIEFVELPESASFVSTLVTRAEIVAGEVTAGRALVVGEPVTRSAVGVSTGRAPSRVMALPLGGWGAAGGELSVGDTIDVVDTRSEPATFVVQAALVVDRSSSVADEGGLGGRVGSEDVWVAVEVTADEALRLAEVVAADEFVVVRSTGVPEG